MIDERHSRTSMLLGEDGIRRLADSFVVVVGVGAVGGYALEGLVRAGVGRIRVVDTDVFSASNLNRQLLSTIGSLGRRKVDVAVERALSINPDIEVSSMDVLVSEDTIPDIMSGDPDVLVDAIDSVAHKVSLLRYVAKNGIVTYSSMGAALRTDPSRIGVVPLERTNTCPLAASVRRGLRGMDTSSITCVSSTEPPMASSGVRDDHGKGVLGSLPTIPAIFGMTLANEAIMHLVCAGHR